MQTRTQHVSSGSAGGVTDGEEVLDMELARPVSQADFLAAMKKVGPSITRGSEVSVSAGESHMALMVRKFGTQE